MLQIVELRPVTAGVPANGQRTRRAARLSDSKKFSSNAIQLPGVRLLEQRSVAYSRCPELLDQLVSATDPFAVHPRRVCLPAVRPRGHRPAYQPVTPAASGSSRKRVRQDRRSPRAGTFAPSREPRSGRHVRRLSGRRSALRTSESQLRHPRLGTALGQAIGGGYTPPAPPGSPPLLPTTGLAGWLGFTPTVLLATLQAAVDDPSNIPGLASYLVYSVLGPPSTLFPPPLGAIPPFPDFPGFPGLPYPFGSYSLFVTTFAPIIAGLEAVLPAPLADALASVSLALNDVLGKALGILPDPINPFVALLPFSALNANVADQLVTAKAAVDPFPESPWVCRRLGLLDFDQGLVAPQGIVERGFELCRG